MSCDQLAEAAWDVFYACIPVTHNEDGDEMEGCIICKPERPNTHRDNCPVPALERALMGKDYRE